MLKYSFLFICYFICTIAQAQTDSIPDRLAWDKTKKNSKELIKLLTDPLNLTSFEKQNPMHSNSGGANKRSYYFKPNNTGFYYRYFLFNNMVGHGPIIVTFQKDPAMKGYMDSSEVFIELSCDKPFKSLGKIDLVNSTLNSLVKKLGDNYLKKGNIRVYQYNKTILLLSGTIKVEWFKIVNLSKPFKNFEELENTESLLLYTNY